MLHHRELDSLCLGWVSVFLKYTKVWELMVYMLRAWSLSSADMALFYSLCDTGQVNLHDALLLIYKIRIIIPSLKGIVMRRCMSNAKSVRTLVVNEGKISLAHKTENSWGRSGFRVYLIHNSVHTFFSVSFSHLWLLPCWLHFHIGYSFVIARQLQKLKHDIFQGSNFRGKSKNYSL